MSDFQRSDKIEVNDLWAAVDGGKPVILRYFPQAHAGFIRSKNFRMRPDDKSPSASVFRSECGKFWFIQDKGGPDNKARNAVTLVMERENLSYGDAIRRIAADFAPHLLSGGIKQSKQRSAVFSKSPVALDDLDIGLRKDGIFTAAELALLGHEITADNCKNLNLAPLDFYVTKKNANGDSWVLSATPDYPMYYYNHGEFGKIYQPFGDPRFLFHGKKPTDYIFGDIKVARLLEKARVGDFPEVDEKASIDERIEHLVICSGPSDALNVAANGYRVCWLTSETADINTYSFSVLRRIAKNIYILYDLDDTGRRNAYRLALKFLDLNIINLPDDLSRIIARNGKPCKDAKDFFMHYRTPKHRNPKKYFDTLVKTAQSLQFWTQKKADNGDFKGFDIDNEQLYGFLAANGIYKIETNISSKGFTFCSVTDNVIKRIDENNIVAHVNNFLISYIKNNPEYYSKMLINSIHRSNQVKLPSLEKIKFGKFDFNSFGRDHDFFFFKNTALRITKEGICPYKLDHINKYVYDFKILDHEFNLTDIPFDVSYSPKYSELKSKFSTLAPSPEKDEILAEFDRMKDEDKYDLNIYDTEFSFSKYLYNSGRVFWKKEETGFKLTEAEKREHDLYFISKVCALGYLMYRYKEKGQAYLVYAMETEQGAVGEHLGGTGKSIALTSTEYCRSQITLDGQRPDLQKNENLFSGVEKSITEIVMIDDIAKDIDLHRFLNTVTGRMEVRAMYRDTEVVSFEESPKVAGTSNHGLKGFDSSLRRRTWFMAFCDYYHPENRMQQIAERSPLTEFGKNLITDYTDDEMNRFYNFMAWCLHTYMKFRHRIQPPMEAINKRNIQRAIGDEFIWWADEYFTDDKLNATIDKDEALDNYKQTLPEKYRDIKMNTFKSRLIQYCSYHGYIYNPVELLQSETELKRNDIRKSVDNKSTYCFHIRTSAVSAPAPVINNIGENDIDRPTGEVAPF